MTNPVLYASYPRRLRRRPMLGLKTSMHRRPAGLENGTARVHCVDLLMTLPYCVSDQARLHSPTQVGVPSFSVQKVTVRKPSTGAKVV